MCDPDLDLLGLGERNCMSNDQDEESGSDFQDATADVSLELDSATVSPPPPRRSTLAPTQPQRQGGRSRRQFLTRKYLLFMLKNFQHS